MTKLYGSIAAADYAGLLSAPQLMMLMSAMRAAPGLHYRDEAYGLTPGAAVRGHNLGLAREISEIRSVGGRGAGLVLVNA